MIKMFFLLLSVASFDVHATYDAGRVAFDRGNFTHAHELWLEAANNKAGSLNNSFQWTRSSDEEQRNAQYAIAVLYWLGKGVDQDYEQAAKWLKRAISSGHIKAQLKLGFLYLQGKGVEKNEVEARKSFFIAAEHGFVDAQFNLGVMYLKGIGGEQNIQQAKYWLKEAALQGDGQAFDELMKFEAFRNNSRQVDDSERLDFEKLLELHKDVDKQLSNEIVELQVFDEQVKVQADDNHGLSDESTEAQVFGTLLEFQKDDKNDLAIKNVGDQGLEKQEKIQVDVDDQNGLFFENADLQKFEERVEFLMADLNGLTDEKKIVKRLNETILEKYESLKPKQDQTADLQQGLMLHQPTWLLRQAGKKYAIQVLAMRSLQKLKSITDALSADGDWVYFVKQRGGRQYFILLRCCFMDKKEANGINQSFPSEIKKLHPFRIHLKKVLPFVVPDQ
jgi:TPR repeat protein